MEIEIARLEAAAQENEMYKDMYLTMKDSYDKDTGSLQKECNQKDIGIDQLRDEVRAKNERIQQLEGEVRTWESRNDELTV